jgi:hypothetical protein
MSTHEAQSLHLRYGLSVVSHTISQFTGMFVPEYFTVKQRDTVT